MIRSIVPSLTGLILIGKKICSRDIGVAVEWLPRAATFF